MLSEREVSAAVGTTAYGTNGDKIGTVGHFFVDDRTGDPTWVSVTTGLFGTRRSVVPAVDATFDDGTLRLPVTVEAVKSAPDLAGDHLDPAEEAELRRHYGVGAPTGLGAPSGPGNGGTERTGTGHHGGTPPLPAAAGPRDDGNDAAMAAPTQEMAVVPPPPPAGEEPDSLATEDGMTRSEERLRVGTERVAATRARLVKYVVTEDVQITVPIRREQIRVEQVPLDAPDEPGESLLAADEDGRQAVPRDGTATGGLPDEIVLHSERPVVSVEVVPVERVRLRTETVQGQEQVTERVEREQIVLEQTPEPGGTHRR